MADIRPFRGLRYNPAVAVDLGSVLCPPYDAITPSERERLYSQSPLNVVRLEASRPLPTDDDDHNPYTRAAGQLADWIRSGVLLAEPGPSYYLAQEEFGAGDQRSFRLGLYASVRLEEYERGVVLPHEHTQRGPKEDRMRLMQATGANFSPIMGLYRDGGALRQVLEGVMAGGLPDYAATTGDDATHRVWVMRDRGVQETVRRMLESQPLYLADGHHRYETALAYRDRRRLADEERDGAASEFVLMCLLEVQDPGLRLLSFHRLVSGLTREGLDALGDRVRAVFDVRDEPMGSLSEDALSTRLAQVVARRSGGPALGLLEPAEGRFSILSLRADAEGLPVADALTPELMRCEPWLLHQGVLDQSPAGSVPGRVEFVHELAEVARMAGESSCQAVFLVPPIDMDVFEAVVRRGRRLPSKSTYFAPKLPTGLVMNSLEGTL